jgi:hypothetical protein
MKQNEINWEFPLSLPERAPLHASHSEQLEQQENALEAAFLIVSGKDKSPASGNVQPPHKDPTRPVALPPETIKRLGGRRKGIVAAFGLFKGTDVFPEDGLEYQLEVRAEWD